jgi:hypothetical protein
VISKLNEFKKQGITGTKMELVKKALQAAAGEGVSAIEKSTGGGEQSGPTDSMGVKL